MSGVITAEREQRACNSLHGAQFGMKNSTITKFLLATKLSKFLSVNLVLVSMLVARYPLSHPEMNSKINIIFKINGRIAAA